MKEETQEKQEKPRRHAGGRPKKVDLLAQGLDDLDFNFDFSKPTLNANERKYVRNCAEVLFYQGLTPYQVSQRVKVAYATALKWYESLGEDTHRKIEETLTKQVGRNVLDFLNNSLAAMTRLAEHCSTPEYLDKHSPEKVSELFRTLGEQSFKLIEARQRHALAQKEIESRRNAPSAQYQSLLTQSSSDSQQTSETSADASKTTLLDSLDMLDNSKEAETTNEEKGDKK